MPRWRRYLRFWRSDVTADVDDELRFHFESRIDELRARGHDLSDATRIAREEFGDVEATRQRLWEIGERMSRRHARAERWLLASGDVRHTLRGLRAAPLFTLGVALTLAIGLGSVITMYGELRQLLLQPPPDVVAPDNLMRAFFHYQRAGDSLRTGDRTSYPYFELLQREEGKVGTVAAYIPDVEVVAGIGPDARLVKATLVSAGFWRALGTRASLGRFIADEEAHPATGARVAVLGHAFWQRRFGGDRGIIGSTVYVKGLPYQVIGVTPREFRGVELSDTDLWLPLFAKEDGAGRPASWQTFASSSILKLVVRVASPESTRPVSSELTRVSNLLIERDEARLPPGRRGEFRSSVTLAGITGALGQDGHRIPEATVAIWVTGVATILLLVACANVTCLLLLRTLRRRREIAVRLALGMSRGRLAAMLLIESSVLALLGAAGACAVVVWGGAWVRHGLLPGMLGASASTDWHSMLLLTSLVLAVALVTGLVPIFQSLTVPIHGLRDGGQQGATSPSALYRSLLVVQTALSTVLLVGAGLFLHSLHRISTTDLGMDTERSLVVGVDFTGSGRSGRERVAFFERALERVRALPDVAQASVAVSAPLRSARGVLVRVHPGAEWISTDQGTPLGDYVSDGFFESTGMRIAQGRAFRAADRGGEPVAIVNEQLAAAGWPGRSPIGECAYTSHARDTCARVVGVVRDARSFRIQEEHARPWIYLPLDPEDVDARVLLVRTVRDARAMRGTIGRALRELDPALPYVDVQSLGDVLDPQIRPWRLGAIVFTALGSLAALLAAFGLYTATAFAVAQRRREIGIRLTVGASPGTIARFILGSAFRVTSIGVAAGLLVALASAHWVADLLFETAPAEPLVLLAVIAGVLVIGILASLVPARRAAHVHPMDVLRLE